MIFQPANDDWVQGVTSIEATPGPSRNRILLGTILLVFGIGWTLTDYARPGLALGAGIILALTVGNPASRGVAKHSKTLLKLSVVGLGFGVPLALIGEAGPSGFVVTSVAVAFAVVVGLGLVPLLGIQREPGWLITIGTAICGGSAIAALGSAIKARSESMAVALGSVFVLNAAALWIFPPIGNALSLSQMQFGVWASIAIHDTASVVGAAAEVGDGALKTATVLKLLRTLWIVPLVIMAAQWTHRHGSQTGNRPSWHQAVPLFILFFALAALSAAAIPALSPTFETLAAWARRLLTTTLFLIGTTLSTSNVKAVGVRPLLLAILLWVIVSIASLAVVLVAF
ncbi:MAG TPA: putative sulfate exporter family transporter [Candidatus Thermoplasmatota archaeon]